MHDKQATILGIFVLLCLYFSFVFHTAIRVHVVLVGHSIYLCCVAELEIWVYGRRPSLSCLLGCPDIELVTCFWSLICDWKSIIFAKKIGSYRRPPRKRSIVFAKSFSKIIGGSIPIAPFFIDFGRDRFRWKIVFKSFWIDKNRKSTRVDRRSDRYRQMYTTLM